VNALARNGYHQPAEPDGSMPQSTEAEETVVGAILVHPHLLPKLQAILKIDNFYHPAARAIYEAMIALDHASRPIDALTVLDQMRALETIDKLRAFNGSDYLTDLMAKVVTVENIGYHARIVRDKATARALVVAAREIAAKGSGDYGDLSDYIAEAQLQLAGATVDRYIPPEERIHPTAAMVLRSDAFKEPQRTYPTCFSDLNDKICGGVKARQLTVVAAPTGSGKTGCIGTIAMAWAHDGIPVLWVCTEIDEQEQASRFAAIDYRQHDAVATPDDFLSLRLDPAAAAAAIENLPLYLLNLDDPDGDPFATIEARARELTAIHGQAPIIILDYLQVLAAEDEDARRMSVTKVSTRLRKLAKDINAAVVAISSVSRAYYGKAAIKASGETEDEDPIHWLAAAKDSGDIEFSSAVFIYLDTSKDVDMLGEASARLVVAKSRRGVRGFVGLRFHGPSGLFRASTDAISRSAGQSRSQQTDDKVLRFINGPVYQPTTMRQLREMVPNVRATYVDASIERLVAGGLLALEQREGHDKAGRKRTDIVVVPAPSNRHAAPPKDQP
jgi:replicative DNA helicase